MIIQNHLFYIKIKLLNKKNQILQNIKKKINVINMKKILIFCVAMCFWLVAKADPWEDLTDKQAKAVVRFLQKNPFILDYCDCCGSGDVYLMKVVSTKIIPCSYNEAKKTVVAEVVRIGKLEVTEGGVPSAYRTTALAETQKDFIITMNYTFVYGKRDKWAVPLFKEVAYDQEHICKGATRFPNPFENNDIKDEDYKKWFRKQKIK